MWFAIAAIMLWLQTPAPSNASLEGHVVRFGTMETIPYVRVVLARVGGRLEDYKTLITEQSGGFAFRDLAPGSYRLYAQRDGYLPSEYGQTGATTSLNSLNPEGVPISLAVGDERKDLVVSLIPPGVIAGRLLDKDRDPFRHVWVRALKSIYRDGERTLTMVSYAETDDLGEYRLFGLAPGLYFVGVIPRDRPRVEGDRYLIPAIPSNDNNNQAVVRSDSKTVLADGSVDAAAFSREGYLTTYYPGTTEPSSASPIEVRPGDTVTGIDMTVTALPTVNIRGTAINGQTSQPILVGASLTLSPAAQKGSAAVATAQVNAGLFEFSGVPAGNYILTGLTNGPAGRMFVETPMGVGDHDVNNVTITFQLGVELGGRIRFEGVPASASEPPRHPPVMLYPGYSIGPVVADGRFFVHDVRPGDYTIRLASQDAYIKTAQFGSRDALGGIHIEGNLKGQQLEITVSYNTATVTARVLDEKEQPAPGSLVVAVPDPPLRNRSDLYRSATTDASGQVRLQSLAPGSYKFFASDGMDAASWQDPEIIRIYESRAQSLQLSEGNNETISLRLLPSRN